MVVAPYPRLQPSLSKSEAEVSLDEVSLLLRRPMAGGVLHLWLMLPVHAGFVLNRHGVDWDALPLVCLDELHKVLGICAVPFGKQPASDHISRGFHPAGRAPRRSEELEVWIGPVCLF